MSNLSNDEEHHEDVQTNDEPHDTDGASATSWSDLDASTSPNDDERLVDKITEVTLYREDWSDFDTTAEAEAERYGEDVDVTILDERPDDPGPDVAPERLENVAERHISASWDAQVGTPVRPSVCRWLTVRPIRTVIRRGFRSGGCGCRWMARGRWWATLDASGRRRSV